VFDPPRMIHLGHRWRNPDLRRAVLYLLGFTAHGEQIWSNTALLQQRADRFGSRQTKRYIVEPLAMIRYLTSGLCG
jgi:hypothetical protein